MKSCLPGLAVAAGLLPLARAQSPSAFALEGPRFEPQGPSDHASFGFVVDVDAGSAAVAEPGFAGGSGAVHVFERTPAGDWVQQAQLTEGLPWPARYGWSLAIGGNTLAVGASGEGSGTEDGACYVYERSGGTWGLVTKLTRGSDEAFGRSLDVDGDALAVGAPGFGDSGPGRAYVYRRVGGAWTLESALPSTTDWGLGAAIAIEGDTVVATNPNAGTAGAAIVYERLAGTWHETHRLEPSDGPQQPSAWFGNGADLEGDVIVVSNSMWSSSTKAHIGAIYIFERSGGAWSETTILQAPDPHNGDEIGRFVRIDGDLVAVGGRVKIANGVLGDCVHLWRRSPSGWTYAGRALSQAEPVDQAWGRALGMDGGVLVAGGTSLAAAFPFDVLPPVGSSYCQAEANSTGAPAAIGGFGSAVIADDRVVLQVVDLPRDRFGFFLMSSQQDFVPGFGGGKGNLCLGGSILRFHEDVLQASYLGEVALQPSLDDLPQGTVVLPGETWSFQLWYRDFDPTLTSNASDGLELTFR